MTDRSSFGTPVAPGARSPGLWELLSGAAQLVIIEIVVAAVVFAIARARRLGRPVIEEPIAPIPAGELVRASAGLYRQARAVTFCGRLLRRSASERLARRVGAAPRRRRAAPREPRVGLLGPVGRAGRARDRGARAGDGRGAPGARRRALGDHPTDRGRQRMSDPRASLAAVRDEVTKAVVGQDAILWGLTDALLVRGHVLLEGVPGVAKTLLVKALARALDLEFRRIQFTPDLMPSDVTGSVIYEARTAEFRFRPGPVFTNLLLADEINRTPPKTQAALLEAMEERQVTIDGEPRPLPDPVHRRRDAEPDRVRGDVPAARGPARPVPVQARSVGLPAAGGRRRAVLRHARRGQGPARPGVARRLARSPAPSDLRAGARGRCTGVTDGGRRAHGAT